MLTRRVALVACGAAVLGLAIAPAGDASSLALKTNHVTFSGAVALPGVTLPRGMYTFEVVELHPRIVRVLSRDGSRPYFTGFTTAVARPANQSPDRVVALEEAPPGVPPRVLAWYPIGQPTGYQFLYPDMAR